MTDVFPIPRVGMNKNKTVPRRMDMKMLTRITVILMTAVMLFGLALCSNSGPDNIAPTQNTSGQSE